SQYTKATGATADAYDELTSQVGPQGNGGTWTPNDWWAHTTTGATVEEPGYSTTDVVNITAFTTPNSDGDRYPQWYAKWVDNWCFSVAPFDFVYCDNAFDGPRYDGAPIDWNRDGVADSETDPTVMAYWRAGMASYWTEIYALMPGMQIMANAGGSYLEATGNLRYPEYQYKVGMALDEGFMGVSYSEETWSGWYNAMGSYGQLEANTAAPNIVLLRCAMTADGMCADTSTQSEYGGGASYAFMRYALASTLMGNGYFEADPNDYSQNPPLWFDEFDLAGTATTGWLGAAIDPPQTTPYQNGVFLRRFENGLAIVNPRTNPDLSVRTAETITLPSGYKHFLGKQDPVTNNGQPVTSITIQAGDGVLLETQ
ncbi:MAG: putative glycoside hydrolase, partial [Opitutaceae bacterium]